MPQKKEVSTLDVLLYWPNIIGYVRFAFLMLSTYFAFSTTYWVLFPVFYGAAYLMDIADGMAEIGNITREQVAVAKERIDVRKWLASVNDPSRFRQNNGGPTVNINVNQLHLEALKKHRDGGITIEGSIVDGE